MIIRIDQTSEEPLYRQIRAQIIESIATGAISPGDMLPSVRSLAQDLGINLHTVNKAYAVLRDEGYLIMKGRKGASVANPFSKQESSSAKVQDELNKIDESMRSLVLAAKAHGVPKEDFLHLLHKQTEDVYGGDNNE